jgi:hypothetical protein
VPQPFYLRSDAWLFLITGCLHTRVLSPDTNLAAHEEQIVAASQSGIITRLVICSGYVLAALPTGISGILFAFYTNSVSPSTHGNFYELYGVKDWRQFGELLKETRPGNAGGILLPWFEAKIVPRVNQPGIHHFDLDEKNVAANCRAIFEAQMMSMRLHSQWMKVSPEKIYATGGASNDLALLQVMAGAMNCPCCGLKSPRAPRMAGWFKSEKNPRGKKLSMDSAIRFRIAKSARIQKLREFTTSWLKNMPTASARRWKNCQLKPAQIRAAALGQAGRGSPLEDEIFDAELPTTVSFAALVAVLVHGVNVRLQFSDFGIGIQPAVAAGDAGAIHRAKVRLDLHDDHRAGRLKVIML